MVKIMDVNPQSPAADYVQPGDVLIKINQHAIRDVIDYKFYSTDSRLTLTLERNQKQFDVSIVKAEYQDLGLEFETYLMDQKQSCRNKCIFCFIDQLPKGMRDTLYFKDDDDRLSFLQGNYVTLTNLTQDEVDRIIRMKMNINVSVHTTNPELRCKMMKNRFAGEALKWLKQFADAGISMNCQLVLCPDWNDGKELERSLNDLGAMMPNIESVALVPVGLTKYRENLEELHTFTKERAKEVIEITRKFQERMLKEFGTRLAYPADEFYLLAEEPFPTETEYEGYPQFENGVGMIRSTREEFIDGLDYVETEPAPRRCTVACGVAAQGLMFELSQMVRERFPQVEVQVIPIINHFFGEKITVTGLLTGTDLKEQLADKDLGDELVLSTAMLRSGTDILLDDMTLKELSEILNIPIRTSTNDGYEVLNSFLGI